MDEKKFSDIDIEENLKIKKNIIKQIHNGFYRIIILWEVNKSPIHGYGIMKKIDLFFQKQIDENILKKSNPSKIYPILKKMEQSGVIKGYWDINDNHKKVKFYEITDKGKIILNSVKYRFHEVGSNPIWSEFMQDMILNPIIDEELSNYQSFYYKNCEVNK